MSEARKAGRRVRAAMAGCRNPARASQQSETRLSGWASSADSAQAAPESRGSSPTSPATSPERAAQGGLGSLGSLGSADLSGYGGMQSTELREPNRTTCQTSPRRARVAGAFLPLGVRV